MRDDARANGPVWLTPEDVCRRFQISLRTLDKWTEQFKLPWKQTRGSRLRRIRLEDIETFESDHFRSADRNDR